MTDLLFVYGTLAPGRPNEHVLAKVPGTWESAMVKGTLLQQGWGSALGYPGLVLDELGDTVHGFVFSSEALAAHWDRLDQFEGDGYERIITSAELGDGTVVQAHIYGPTPFARHKITDVRGNHCSHISGLLMEAFFLPGPDGYLRSSSSSSIRP